MKADGMLKRVRLSLRCKSGPTSFHRDLLAASMEACRLQLPIDVVVLCLSRCNLNRTMSESDNNKEDSWDLAGNQRIGFLMNYFHVALRSI